MEENERELFLKHIVAEEQPWRQVRLDSAVSAGGQVQNEKSR